ncbi:MAG: gluconate 2-dehydrogenase subunit 3 family protein [Ginsengibacter sp.]
MKRRRFLSSVAILVPAALVSTEVLLPSCNRGSEDNSFSQENINLLDEIGETIIPATATSPGAKAARIGDFMKVYVPDCYTAQQQAVFWEGINKVKKLSNDRYGKEFPKLAVSQKQAVLRSLENESIDKAANNNNGTQQFYPMIKGLVAFGFFSSKPGATKALRYEQTPDGYVADVPYKKGDKAWATS